ncbi:MAG: ABC transporter ATP-binding protein [Gemmataceae bacterium]
MKQVHMLIADNVTKDYSTRPGPLAVLREVSLRLELGESLAVIGPSGSGKSTLLHILGTLDRPSSGTVTLGGVDPFALAEPALAEFRNRRIGFVFQDHHLLPQCSVLENVLVPFIVRQDKPADLVDQAKRLLERVGLGARLDHRPAELSGGERQRVALARALFPGPELVLADEPTGNLDRASAKLVGELLMELHRERPTILVTVTHSSELAALFPRRMEIVDGKLVNG